jgi:DNA repair protein RecN (Recombination protein N)
MPNVRFDIQVQVSQSYFSNGKDEVQFLFSANKGTDFGILKKKVASGGEMSTGLCFAVKQFSQYSKLPTLFFDEIDTGVSSEMQ